MILIETTCQDCGLKFSIEIEKSMVSNMAIDGYDCPFCDKKHYPPRTYIVVKTTVGYALKFWSVVNKAWEFEQHDLFSTKEETINTFKEGTWNPSQRKLVLI